VTHPNRRQGPGPLALLVFLIAGALPAAADSVIFSDLGPLDRYNSGVGLTIGGRHDVSQGGAFTTPAGAKSRVDAIQIVAGLIRGPNRIELELLADQQGRPGKVLETFQPVTDMLQPFGRDGLVTFTTRRHLLLAPDTRYWLIAIQPDASSGGWAGWNFNAIGLIGQQAVSLNGGASYSVSRGTLPAFRVLGTYVAAPEPTTLTLAGLGLLALAAHAWHRRSWR
jgi:hypothetical protein